MSCTFI